SQAGLLSGLFIHAFLHLFTHPRTPGAALFPYTTLFRSQRGAAGWHRPSGGTARENRGRHRGRRAAIPRRQPSAVCLVGPRPRGRSEEHTSELQSRENLVCRLLLEKKSHLTDKAFAVEV